MELRYTPRGPFRRALTATGAFAFFGLAVTVFVTPPRKPSPAPKPETPSADTATADFAPAKVPLRSLLPIQTPRPQDLDIAVSHRVRMGDIVKSLHLEIRSSERLAAVVASTAGAVEDVRLGPSGRATVVLRSLDGQVAEYGNLERVDAQAGQIVTEGETIGRAGPPPVGDGSLLWYEVQTAGSHFPPLWMETRRPGAGTQWTLEIGPLGELSTRLGG